MAFVWWSDEADLIVSSLVCELPWITQQHSSVSTYHQLRNKQFCLLLVLQDEDRNTIQALWKPPKFIHYEGQIVTEGLTFPCHFVLNIILMLLKTCIIAEV